MVFAGDGAVTVFSCPVAGEGVVAGKDGTGGSADGDRVAMTRFLSRFSNALTPAAAIRAAKASTAHLRHGRRPMSGLASCGSPSPGLSSPGLSSQ